MSRMHAHITASSPPLSERELHTQIRDALSDKFTGQIQITAVNDRTASIFVQHGIVHNVYIRNHRLPDLNWELLVTRFDGGTLRMEPLPPESLMLRKVALEAINPPPPVPTGTQQLETMTRLAEHGQNPTLFHIRWETAEAFVLVAGEQIPICRSALVTLFGVEEGNRALEQILNWDEPECQVMTYHGDIKSQAWLELYLNILLEWYCRNILSYYQQLTGAVMVQSILQSLAVMAETKGWSLSTQNQQVLNASLFSSAAAAGNEYREILTTIRSRIEPIIGSSLTEYLMKRSIESTRGVYKIVQETFELVEGAQ